MGETLPSNATSIATVNGLECLFNTLGCKFSRTLALDIWRFVMRTRSDNSGEPLVALLAKYEGEQ